MDWKIIYAGVVGLLCLLTIYLYIRLRRIAYQKYPDKWVHARYGWWTFLHTWLLYVPPWIREDEECKKLLRYYRLCGWLVFIATIVVANVAMLWSLLTGGGPFPDI